MSLCTVFLDRFAPKAGGLPAGDALQWAFGACLLSLAASLSLGCEQSEPEQVALETTRVLRRDIAYSAIADGVVEPLLTVEVKSKASGEILSLPVDTGDEVEAGDVLVRIDPVDAQNAVAQAESDLEATLARRKLTESSLRRAEQLYREGMFAESEYDLAVYEARQAEADAVKARITLDLARRRLEETTVKAPLSGTILTKNVEVGNVIASAVTQVSGGTILMTMADLSMVEIRSLVDEVDIGQIAPEMPVRITVEAYPGRVFEGQVTRIEPQAVVEQNVTLFPVLVRLQNDDRSLRPGMNAEIEILVDRRDDVTAVPVEAVRAPNDVALAARLLGMDAPAPIAAASEVSTRGRQDGRPATGRAAVAFVRAEDGPVMREVRVGLSDWDYAEILSGLSEGEEVILLPSSAVLRQQEEILQRMRRTRSLPGMGGRSKKQPRSRGGS
ncbi:MAG: efflux RND transporter periplasmic adaptor subunit [Acidobacteriota bacterium]